MKLNNKTAIFFWASCCSLVSSSDISLVKNSVSPGGRPHEGHSPITHNPNHMEDTQILTSQSDLQNLSACSAQEVGPTVPPEAQLFTAKAIPPPQAAKQHHLCWQLSPGHQETVESFVFSKALKTIIFPKVASHRRNRLVSINYVFLCYFFPPHSFTTHYWPSTVIRGPTWEQHLAHCRLHFSYRHTAQETDLWYTKSIWVHAACCSISWGCHRLY